MIKYEEVFARAEGATPQERIIAILKEHDIAIRISSWEDVTITMKYDGFTIVDEDGAYLDMLPGPHKPLSGPDA